MRVAAWILGSVGMVAAASAGAAAQTYATPAETPAAALSRHLRTLATSPRDFVALIGAGKAALAMGDSQAAAGFFGRADEVWPTSALPQIGMGAAMVAEGDAQGALTYFAQAQQRGASQLQFTADRGLAYDLLGRHTEAQADYRVALLGADADEARRRLALSLAISGTKDGRTANARCGNARRRRADGAVPGPLAGAPLGAEGGRRQPRHFPRLRAVLCRRADDRLRLGRHLCRDGPGIAEAGQPHQPGPAVGHR
jgi:tetratricopeptide (TPR) repeat protein